MAQWLETSKFLMTCAKVNGPSKAQFPYLPHYESVNFIMKMSTYIILFIDFGFYPYTPMCVSNVYSVLSPSLVKQYHRHVTRVGFEPTTLEFLEQRLLLGFRDCPVARVSSNSMLFNIYYLL